VCVCECVCVFIILYSIFFFYIWRFHVIRRPVMLLYGQSVGGVGWGRGRVGAADPPGPSPPASAAAAGPAAPAQSAPPAAASPLAGAPSQRRCRLQQGRVGVKGYSARER